MQVLLSAARDVSSSWQQIEAFTKRENNDGRRLRVGTVLIVTPGRLEHGGVGRQTGYFLGAHGAGLLGLH